MSGILNLKKNDVLDLTKAEPGLNKVMLGAGWDVVKKSGFFSRAKDYDLDLVALQINEDNKLIKSGLIYFGHQLGQGIRLHGDNLTGAGDGDDEKISVELSKLSSDCKKVVFAVSIYDAVARKQSFSGVKNAYVRLLNEDKNLQEICRYNLTEDGGESTSIIFAELEKINGNWNFKATGQLLKGTIKDITNMYK
ncbi:TerD family protein [Clostridium sp.]|uniref:TerD family protein n=1 Tax=Clostridium sp. TaxID=1506 RepID=UPI003F2C744E